MKLNVTEINNIIEQTIEQQVEERVADVCLENAQLVTKVNDLQKEIIELKDENSSLRNINAYSQTMRHLMEQFKEKCRSATNSAAKSTMIYELLSAMFYKDFDENVYECPVWLGALTNFYSNKKLVIELLDAINEPLPLKIDSFRLPIEWTEEELDIFFEHMDKHVNCNGCIYSDNLRFWKPMCLDSVEKMCAETTFSEIPWQFVLRNPLLKQEKYLKQIGNKAFSSDGYRSKNWLNFFKITQFQALTEEEIKIILSNMNIKFPQKGNINEYLKNFLINNMHLIENDDDLMKVYEEFCTVYSFTSKNILTSLPYKYIKKYVSDNKGKTAIDWITNHRKDLTEIQRKELMLIAMED